ncbi:MAG: histidinol-phosphatase [Candidatus Methylacidiphilales bacterium]|nr:histidinol-phosphatase [Candidatus Methylacidiphilales bacterium]
MEPASECPPRLVYETHSHTPLCKHAEGEPEDYARRAWERGMKGLTITCHGPLPDDLSASVRMTPEQFPQYLDLVAGAREVWAGRVDVLLGLESDYLPGLEDWIEALHKRADFHYVLGSVHPHIREYRERYYSSGWADFHRGYFGHLADAAETGLFDCLAHPDIVKNLGPAEWDIDALMSDIRRALDRIAATGIAMELNTSGVNKVVPEMNPAPQILREMYLRGIPVVVGADAHVPERVGDGYARAYDHLEAAGYDRVHHFIGRQKQSLAITEARLSLQAA